MLVKLVLWLVKKILENTIFLELVAESSEQDIIKLNQI